MQIVRTIMWVLLFVALTIFTLGNWDKRIEVHLWENLIWDTRLPAVVIVCFLFGIVPMWLYHRSVKWSLGRRIRSLEASIKSTALAHRTETVPAPASTPVDKAGDEAAEPDDILSPTPPSTGDNPA